MPIHHDNHWLLGMEWKNAVFIDTVLSFGLRLAPKFRDTAEWIVKQQGVEFVIHYLNDFLLVGRPGSSECSAGLRCLLRSFAALGFPMDSHG